VLGCSFELAGSSSWLTALTCSSILVPQMLQVVKAEAESLAASTDDTAALAQKVSRKVRELDTAQSRVQATLGHISVVLDRMRAVEGIQSSLAAEDFEAAAECVGRYLELEDEMAAEMAASSGTPAADQSNAATSRSAVAAMAAAAGLAEADSRAAAEQAQVLVEGRAKLEGIVRSRGRAAAAAGDHADVVRFTRLHKPLRLQAEGQELLVGFLRRLIADRAASDYATLADAYAGGGEGGGGGPDYVGTLTNLFKDVAAAVDEHLELMRDTFGAGACFTALHRLPAGAGPEGAGWLVRQACLHS
jgi:hypothetical protein